MKKNLRMSMQSNETVAKVLSEYIQKFVKDNFKWCAVDLYGVCFHSKKPKKIKKFYTKKDKDFFCFFSSQDFIEVAEQDLSEVKKSLKQNPELYKVQLRVEIISIEEAK